MKTHSHTRRFSKWSTNQQLSNSNTRKWLHKHGKQKYIDFDTQERKKYREIFDAMDGDGSGSIGIDELEEPFIALGLVTSREEIKEMINSIDQDGNGEIDFQEFLLIMLTIKKNDSQKDSSLFDFFRDMVNGDFSKMEEMEPGISFKLNISQYRRKKLLEAITLDDNDVRKIKAQNILNVR